MTDLVKSLKIGNNSYGIKDEKATPFLSSTDEAILSFNGTYRGEALSDFTSFIREDGSAVEKAGFLYWPVVMTDTADVYRVLAANDTICVLLQNNSTKALYTTDYKTWTETTLPESVNWRSAVYGNGKFVAIAYGSNVGAYSTDGINWTSMTMPDTISWSHVTYGGGKFVAIAYGSSTCAYSTDGITWSSGVMPSSEAWRQVAYGNGRYVATAGGSISAYSVDGSTWTSVSMSENRNWRTVAFSQGKFVTVASVYGNPTAIAAYSTDGESWTDFTINLDGQSRVFKTQKGFVFVDSSRALYSEDLVHYKEIVRESKEGIATDVANTSNRLIMLEALSTRSVISSIPFEVVTSTVVAPSWTQAIAYGNGKFVAVPMNNDKGAYSTDGLVWNEMTMPSSNRWTTCVYGNGTFVSTLDLDNSDVAAYSTDGITWQATTLPATGYWNCLMFADNKFVAVAYATTDVAYSTDGITWQASTHPAIGSVYDTAYGNGVFVLLSPNNVAYSSDAATWQSTSLPSGHQWYYVTYGGGKFVAIDYNVQTGSTSAVYSTNGSTWQSSTLPVTAVWEKPVYGNGRFVVTGHTMDSPAVWVCAYSTDGITWSLARLPFTTAIGQITARDGLFVALANNQSSASDITVGAYSTDGATWIPFEAPSYSQFTAIVSGADKFVAAARNRGSGMDWTYYLLALKIGFLPYSKELSYTKSEVDTALASKQGTLTAGTGISISQGIITNTGLINTATGTNLTIGGTATTSPIAYGNINIGQGSKITVASIPVQGGIAIGQTSEVRAINAVALGRMTLATGSASLAIGFNARSTAEEAYQIGRGTNANSRTLQVGFWNPDTERDIQYQLLDSSGNIPAARLSNIYEVVQTLPASTTEGKIYFVTGA